MTQMWIEKIKAAPTKLERDDVLLREFNYLMGWHPEQRRDSLIEDVRDQLRALADLAFPK